MACAMHCALMPLAVTILPLLGLAWLANEWVELGLFFASAILGISSLCMGYRQHKDRRAPAILAVGLALLALGHYAHEHDWGFNGVILLVVGGLTVAGSHWYNHVLCKQCHSCNHKH